MSSSAPLASHLVLRLVDGRVIAPTTASRRGLARALFSIGLARGLVAFRAADTHVHALIVGPPAPFAQAVESAVKQRLGLPAGFLHYAVAPVRDQHHLRNTLHYVLRQEVRHRVVRDPHHEASALPDLVGARVLGAGAVDRLRALLPRTTRTELVQHLGVDALGEEVHPQHLVEATAAAFGTDTTRLRTHHRRVAVAAAAGLATGETAALLGVDRRTVQRLRRDGVAPAEVRAVRLQMALRAAVPLVDGDFGGPEAARAIPTAPAPPPA